MSAVAASPALGGEVVAEFTIEAVVCPQVVARMLAYFSQQNLVPLGLGARRDAEGITLVVRQDGLTEHRAQVIAEKMRSIVTVRSVRLDCRPVPADEGRITHG